MALSKTNQVNVRNARAGRNLVDDGYYARAMSAAFRCSTLGQQKAILDVIAEDATMHLFAQVNGTLVAA